ncbi:MAG: HIT domain-containing protein [Chloroflexi bacterium]|nr:HIT domain-containing protein [Chloroflexota bacterium]
MTVERLYTPWRMKYVATTHTKVDGCVFCAKCHESPERDRENFLVYRGQTVFAIMNIFPYNTGHLMILPYQHVATLIDVPPDVQFELIILTTYFTELLTDLMRPDGFNVGINIGRAAGAGIDSHLHVHIVPRWSGDSNFMPVIGETRVLPEQLEDTYDRIVTLINERPPAV